MSRQIWNDGNSGDIVKDVIDDNFIELYNLNVSSEYYIIPEGETFNNAVTNSDSIENLVINHEISLTLNITTTKNLIVLKGGLISGAYTLTHNGGMYAGFYQIYNSNLTVRGNVTTHKVIADWWGVDPTGVSDSFYAINEAIKRMGDGFLFTLSKGNYRVLTSTGSGHAVYHNCTFDFNNSVWDFEGDDYFGFGQYSALGAFTSNPFAEDFVKGSNYIVVNDKDEWLALTNWNDYVKITITTTEIIWPNPVSGSYYYDPMSIDIDRFETVGAEDRMYFKYPCPRDFDVDNVTYPLREYNGYVVRYWPKKNNLTFKNLTVLNGQFWLMSLGDVKFENMTFLNSDDYVDTHDDALLMYWSDNINITNYRAENYRKASYGYGINTKCISRLFVSNAQFKDCRHSFSGGGGYTELSYMFRLTNIELISTGKENVDGDIDAHGNMIDFVVDGVRAIGVTKIFSSRSASGIVRNIYGIGITATPFIVTDIAAPDLSHLIIQNVYLQDCSFTVIEILECDLQFLSFENIHTDQNVNIVDVDNCAVNTIHVNDCSVNKVPAISSKIVTSNGGSITALYLNNTLIP